MSDLARADLDAIGDVVTSLSRLDIDASVVAADASRRLAQALAQANAAVAQRQSELQRREADLATCRSSRMQPPPDCSPLAAAVARTRARLAAAQQAVSGLEQAISTHQAAQARFQRELSSLIAQGRRLLSQQRANLQRYLTSGQAPGPGSTTGVTPVTTAMTSDSSIHVPAGVPDGYALVPLSAIDYSLSEVRGPADFRKGYSIEDLTWSYAALHKVVLPALAQGLGADYFTQRDAAEHRLGTRSYAMCYSGFFTIDDAIILEPGTSGYRVTNGYHRIWLARQHGLDAVPAYSAERRHTHGTVRKPAGTPRRHPLNLRTGTTRNDRVMVGRRTAPIRRQSSRTARRGSAPIRNHTRRTRPGGRAESGPAAPLEPARTERKHTHG